MKNHVLHQARVITLGIILLASMIISHKSFSQDVQGWLDSYLVKPFGYFEYEANLGMARLLENDGWRDYYIGNTLSYQRINWYLIEAALEYHHTVDPLAVNINEIKVFLGQKFYFTTFMEKIHLQLPYFYLQLEDRFMSYPEDGTTDQKLRLRARVGGRFLINNIFIDNNTWYIPFYAEYFFNFNGEAFERYASRNRYTAGVGYAFTKKLRTELMYYAQRSRNTQEDSFEKTDIMFQLSLRYYLLKDTQ